ncbi:hypothetical protein AB0M46_30605 [Dactylosporangium sp. NPDC051485]|uniref:hypothetical protein n=1 Tax=Dactylosporangium sp. NPDC051485 TaxID=3154846 RepID=UPI0034213E48
MGELVPLPKTGDVFSDVRGDERTMRVTCHPHRGTVVVSLWVDKLCRASFQLAEADLPRLQQALLEMRFDQAAQVAESADRIEVTHAPEHPGGSDLPASA